MNGYLGQDEAAGQASGGQQFAEQGFEVIARLGKGIVVGAEDGANLNVEIGVMLGECPD